MLANTSLDEPSWLGLFFFFFSKWRVSLLFGVVEDKHPAFQIPIS